MPPKKSLTLRVYMRLAGQKIGPKRRARLLRRLLRQFGGDSGKLIAKLGVGVAHVSCTLSRGGAAPDGLPALKSEIKKDHVLTIIREKRLTSISSVSREGNVNRTAIYNFLRQDPKFKKELHLLIRQNQNLKRKKSLTEKRPDQSFQLSNGQKRSIERIKKRAGMK